MSRMPRLSRFVAVMIAALLTAMPTAMAQPGGADPEGVIASFDPPTLSALLDAYGYDHDVVDSDGQTVIRVAFEGRTIALWPRACNGGQTGCLGLAIEAYYHEPLSDGAINDFNKTAYIATMSRDGGHAVLRRYLMADYGIAARSIDLNIRTFAGAMDQYTAFFQKRTGLPVVAPGQ